jgi:nucleoside-diphosphate-sugar epimerase
MAQNDSVVILGGAGFIGSTLLGQLNGRVRHIKVVSRKASGTPQPGVEYVAGDVCDGGRMVEVLEGATVVYQLTVEGDFKTGATNVAEACLQHGVRRLIFTSTSDALYLARKGTILEDAPTDPKPQFRNAYSQGKAESEKVLLEYRARRNLPVVIMRPCLVVGRGGKLDHGGIGAWASTTCLVGWGNGRNPMPFVLVDDVADAMVRAMDAPGIEGRAFNLAGDVYLSAREYIDILAQRSLRDFRFFPRNLQMFGLLVATKAAVNKIATGKVPADRQYYRDMLSSAMVTHIDNSSSKKLLGWKPNSSREVFIREAIDSNLEPIHPDDLRLQRD